MLSLTDEDRATIAKNMELCYFDQGKTVFQQGDIGDAFYIVCEGEANVMVRPSNFIKVSDEVRLLTELTFAGNSVPAGTVAKIDKYDPSRDYPYTVRVRGTGQRGRVLPEEIELLEGNPEDRHIAKLKPGDYFGEQSLLRNCPRNATIVGGTNLQLAMLDAKKFKENKMSNRSGLGINLFIVKFAI